MVLFGFKCYHIWLAYLIDILCRLFCLENTQNINHIWLDLVAKKVVGLNICKHGFCWKYYLKLFKIYNYSSTLACLTLNIHLSGIIIFCYKKELQFWSNWFCFINQTAFNKFPNSCSVSNLTISISMKGTAQRKWKMKFSAHFLRFIHTHTQYVREFFFLKLQLATPSSTIGQSFKRKQFRISNATCALALEQFLTILPFGRWLVAAGAATGAASTSGS